ncbi:hypothetical protein L1049_011850 [Liquidambar formosana]|uniref:Plastocyanin-like domain-containing protein n=1 Tax=Liquidambar formosana TaxID=63359 RepID=A0AAP0X043_LIQFO
MALNIGFLGLIFLNGLLLCMAQGPLIPVPAGAPTSAIAGAPTSAIAPAVPVFPLEYDFVVNNDTSFTRLCSTKKMLTVNGGFPGPEIRVRKGDTVKVNVFNNANYSITLHWHGLKQPRNPWSDGPEYVTQCPIKPYGNFTQELIFSDEEGTIWWHAHSDWSRATVHGAIVVYPPEGTPYPYPIQPDGEQTLVLASWYNEDVNLVYEQAASYAEPDVSDAFTVNGLVGDLYATDSCSNESSYIHAHTVFLILGAFDHFELGYYDSILIA